MPSPERRRHPRVAESVSCKLEFASCRLSAKTLNLSCGGALCALAEPIPVMTKLVVCLEVPAVPLDGGPSVFRIRCAGVVVRQERSAAEEDPAPYRTAIYFSDLKPEDRRRLAEFILQSMLRH